MTSAPAGGTLRQRLRRHPGRAGARAASCGAGARRTRPPRESRADPPGANWTRPVTESVNSTGHPAPAHARISAASSSAVSRSSSAEAVMRVAPARSSRPSRVTSDSRVSTATAAPSAAGPGASAAASASRSGVAVVEDPALRPGQERREPPAHRPAAAAEVVDHRRPPAGRRRAEVRDELSGPGRRVRALAQVEPARADPDRLDGHRAAPARTSATSGRGRRPAGERRTPFARRPPQPPAQVGVLEPGSERVAERGRVVGRNEQARPGAVGAVPQSLRHPADLGGDHRQAACKRLGDDHPVRLPARREHQQVRRAVAARRARLRSAGPEKRTRPSSPPASDAAAQTLRRMPGRAPGCRRTGSCQRRPASIASASSSTSWPLPGITAATESSAPAVAVPGASSAASAPGSATWTRSPGSE